MPEFDIAIVGAGIAGASLAYRLAPLARVVVLERESAPGYHSTGRSAAMFMESYGPPQVRALTRASRAFYAAPPTAFSEAPILAPRGVLYVARAGQHDLLDAQARALDDTGIAVEHLDAAGSVARLPALKRVGLLGALFEPDASDIDVHALHQGWLRGARRHHAALWCDAELTRAVRHDGAWTLALRDGRRLRAELLVDAAGAWADEVAALAGVEPIGLQPRRRSAFTFDAPAGADHRSWPTAVGIDEGWYFKPDAGQLLGSPANADDVPAHDVQAEEIDIATAIARIEAATTLVIRRPRRVWAGLRTFAPDGELVIGFDPSVRGFFWLAGQGGYGIQSADGAADLAHALLQNRTPCIDGVDVALMAPDRIRRGR